ncbi:hypothetical protein B9Z55_010924 [Caenorhabditis nigoni]|uniref:Uncharacterized protein n=3 Tax=Caenorhabditis nigoni TaxID=1611254 RepID=A0A2G5UIH1_9PELO|nr:hypothetical protein B9Z55_010924 [Caenorhabditis nigoni]
MNKPKPDWGAYYYQGKRKNGKTRLMLDVVHQMNQAVPTFNELFDEETFYVFAFLVVVVSIVFVIIMARCFKVKITEYDIDIDREWRDMTPANPFRFPWDDAKKNEKAKLKKE